MEELIPHLASSFFRANPGLGGEGFYIHSPGNKFQAETLGKFARKLAV